jgi:hypothetical protein
LSRSPIHHHVTLPMFENRNGELLRVFKGFIDGRF